MILMERRVRGNSHARCGSGENPMITSKDYLSTLQVDSLGRGGGGQPVVDALSSGKLVIALMNPGVRPDRA